MAEENNTRQRRTEPPSQELVVAQVRDVAKILDDYRRDLTRVMPRQANADTFMGLALAAVKKSPQLRKAVLANPQSFVLALRECAYLGHVVTKSQGYLLPFNSKDAPGGQEIVFVEAYQGLIQRMLRANPDMQLVAQVGRDNDPVLRFNATTMRVPDHQYDEFASAAERGPLKVAYAFGRFASGGTSGVAWLPASEIARHRSFAKTDKFWGPVWPAEGTHTADMWRKTAINVLEQLVPLSSEYREQQNRAADAAAVGFGDLGQVPVEQATDTVWDAEVVE